MSAARYASIDCGTNSIRLLISEVDPTGTLTELHRDNIIVRLGEGVDATGEFAPAALTRVDEALATYTTEMERFGVRDVMMGATSATRDAGNRDDFFGITGNYLGRIRPGAQADVISGVREAELSFAGAITDLGREDTTGVLVIDLGGGSTEFVVDTGSGLQAHSADMGCVRITERFLPTLPPTAEELSAARAFVAERMEEVAAKVDFDAVTDIVGVAGTLTTLAALTKGLETYDREQIHMAELPLREVREMARTLLTLTPEERLNYGPMHPGRADVIGGGAIVVEAFTSLLIDRGHETMTVSEKDILDGMLADVIARH